MRKADQEAWGLRIEDLPDHLRPMWDGSYPEFIGTGRPPQSLAVAVDAGGAKVEYSKARNVFQVVKDAMLIQWVHHESMTARLAALEGAAENMKRDVAQGVKEASRAAVPAELHALGGRVAALERRLHAARILLERLNVRTQGLVEGE